MTDQLAITGIEVFGRHGVFEAEQVDGQTFVVDLKLDLDLSRAGNSDDLGDTVDYATLTQRVHDLVASERWDLIERVAQRVADLVLDDDRISAATVTLHKPQAPIPVPFSDVAVTIKRER